MLPNVINGMDWLATTIVWKVPVGGRQHEVKLDHCFLDRRLYLFVDGERQFEVFADIKKKPNNNKFKIGSLECSVVTEKTGNVFSYSLEAAGKTLKEYKETFSKKCDTWVTEIGGKEWKVVLDKNSLEILVNGEAIEAERDFAENGTVTHFLLDKTACRIEAKGGTSSGMSNTFFTPEGEVPLFICQDPEIYKYDADRFFKSGYACI